ncbi:MAG: hypothetical protein QM296_02570 [Bacillota bacterium]|nr:hypothetical protein [Bacillota bacterium]
MSKTKIKLMTAAACLVLLIAVTVIVGNSLNWFRTEHDAAAGAPEAVVPGGTLPEGVDPVMASVAVFPADRSLLDVASATLKQITEAEAHGTVKLGDHLPTSIPDPYQFSHASLYETTMKDGTKYYLLRVHYSTGDKGNLDMNHHAPDFFVQLMNYKPSTKKTIYTITTIPAELSGKGFLHVACGDFYVGFDYGELTHDEIMQVLNSIS